MWYFLSNCCRLTCRFKISNCCYDFKINRAVNCCRSSPRTLNIAICSLTAAFQFIKFMWFHFHQNYDQTLLFECFKLRFLSPRIVLFISVKNFLFNPDTSCRLLALCWNSDSHIRHTVTSSLLGIVNWCLGPTWSPPSSNFLSQKRIATALGVDTGSRGIEVINNTAAAVVVTRKVWYSNESYVGKAGGQLHGKILDQKLFYSCQKFVFSKIIKSMCAVAVRDKL